MMDDLDRTLDGLRGLPLPAGLQTLEANVMGRIVAEREARALTAAPVLGVAAAVALGLGMAGAVLPGSPAHATPVGAFGYGADLAPSTLLANVG